MNNRLRQAILGLLFGFIRDFKHTLPNRHNTSSTIDKKLSTNQKSLQNSLKLGKIFKKLYAQTRFYTSIYTQRQLKNTVFFILTVIAVFAGMAGHNEGAYALDEWLPRVINTDKPDCSSHGGDMDDDGICDNWEGEDGLRPDWPNGADWFLPCTTYDNGDQVCPRPDVKDIYVEIDYMEGHYPDVDALEQVRAAFAAYDPPINLHYFIDEKVLSHSYETRFPGFNRGTTWGFDQVKQCRFGTLEERGKTESDPCEWANQDNRKAKKAIFHYALYVHAQKADTTSSGIAEVFGNDFMISLGAFSGGVGSTDEQAGTFMHELGHNLRLHHGGSEFDTVNCKPNHLSVMNYARQFSNLVSDRALDYSRAKVGVPSESQVDPLNENALKEWTGLSNYEDNTQRIVYGPIPPLILPTTGGMAIDWDLDGFIQESTSSNINSVEGCPTSSLESLDGHDDWTRTYLDFTESGSNYADGLPAATGTRIIVGNPFEEKDPEHSKEMVVESIGEEINKKMVVDQRILRITALECFLNLEIDGCVRVHSTYQEAHNYESEFSIMQIKGEGTDAISTPMNSGMIGTSDDFKKPEITEEYIRKHAGEFSRMPDDQLYRSDNFQEIQQIKNELLKQTTSIKKEVEDSYTGDEGLRKAIKTLESLQKDLKDVLNETPYQVVILGTDDIIKSFNIALDFKPTSKHDGLKPIDVHGKPEPPDTSMIWGIIIGFIIAMATVVTFVGRDARIGSRQS